MGSSALNVGRSAPTGAVFLSYAREDADAARRITEALRAAGVEVWFDEDELRGGDAWDAHIRQRIRECALFLPVISAQSQARAEGYFRREWKLADQRMEDMGRRRSFLIPVCIDATRETDADVPESFLRFQWTRLKGGESTPAFLAQVKRLLDSPAGVPSPVQPDQPPATPGRAPAPPAPVVSRRPAWVLGAGVAVVAAVAAAFYFSRSRVASPAPAPAPLPAAKPERVMDKSIAVLPFTNMSEDKDSTFFADGVHEDILTNLALIRELRVVSRTTVMQYRGTTKSMKQLAQELGVTYILEGSVRRSGDKVRVTGQLIHAATDEHVWAKTYDRNLTDIFAIQGELAQGIARELKTALSPVELAQVEQKSTDNLEAYDLFLRARSGNNRMGADFSAEGMQGNIKLLERAVELDPGFYRAWALLASVHAQMIGAAEDESDERARLAWHAVEQVVRLAPESREAHEARGAYFYGRRDYVRANEETEWIIQHYPQDAEALRTRGFVQRRWGRWGDALATLRRALELDPGNITTAHNLALHLWEMRRYDEARAAYQRLRELRPETLDAARLPADLGSFDFLARGSTAEGDAFFAGLQPTERTMPGMVVRQKTWALQKGDDATYLRLAAQFPDPQFAIADAQLLSIQRPDPAAVRARLEPLMTQLRADLKREPKNYSKRMYLAFAEAVAGDHAAAHRGATEAMAGLSISSDAFVGGYMRYYAATIFAWCGDKDQALALLAERLRAPPAVSTFAVRKSLEWWPLRGDPRFEVLLNDPKNNAPLF